MRAGHRLSIFDDDPTGSQCVAGIDVAFADDPLIPVAALAEPDSACFVLTNGRALDEDRAIAVNRRLVRGDAASGHPTERDACGLPLGLTRRSMGRVIGGQRVRGVLRRRRPRYRPGRVRSARRRPVRDRTTPAVDAPSAASPRYATPEASAPS
ncbi:MAG: hypothetical protein L0G46_00520 [Kocuria sp.]|nr:four-carbon acid sugar kinase family protein [Brachybacterium fresconis]MDN5653561.1 hypothetical protein [Kocuria sp.]